ncbi:MAG: HEAT repeat domain-containing protein [Phycisphaerae bacterium]|nr:HEAT repeat domain-containing protein [Phycisphaerae bacterium]
MSKEKLRIFVLILILTCLFTNCYGSASETVKSLVANAEKIVSDGLKSPEGIIRTNAIEVVSSSKKIEFLPEIVGLLNDNIMLVRFAAAVAIGDMEYKGSEKQLQQLLNDLDVNVKIAAAYALCKLGEKQHLAIIQKAAEVNDQAVKANAAWLLGKLKSTESLPILYRLKDSGDSSDKVAFVATEAIARIGDEKIYNKIWTMLISVYVDDRCMGIYAMGALGGERGRDTILTMLDDDIPQVRLIAAEQLGALGDKSGQFVVLEYLAGPKQQEKFSAERCDILAALAIGRIGTDKLTEYLPKLLKNDSPAARLAAAKSVFILEKPN